MTSGDVSTADLASEDPSSALRDSGMRRATEALRLSPVAACRILHLSCLHSLVLLDRKSCSLSRSLDHAGWFTGVVLRCTLPFRAGPSILEQLVVPVFAL